MTIFTRKTNSVDDVLDNDINELQLAIEDGWQPISATWTRTGNHSFAVAGDVTAIYEPGVKIRYKDGGAFEYGVVASSAHAAGTTTVTLITNSDYAMADVAITDRWISRVNQPSGWPEWFNYAPTFTGFSADPAGGVYRWRADGRRIEIFIRQSAAGTSNATTFTISAPVTAREITTMLWRGTAGVTDNGTNLTPIGSVRIVQNTAVINVYTDAFAGAWTNSGAKAALNAWLVYEY
jgi:hypothetical protein